MSKSGSGQASVPMNLFATWEIDRSSSICIPRVCTMTICHLNIFGDLDKELQSVFITAKMQDSKRFFRSIEIIMPSSGVLNTKLEMTFSLQYPHMVKRDESTLQILLQRKKRIKNRTMLGYKTLALCEINLAQILQCPVLTESVLDLYSAAGKDQELIVVAKIHVSKLNSLPADADTDNERMGKNSGAEQVPVVDNYSEEDDESCSSGPDTEYIDEDTHGRGVKRKNRRNVRMSANRQQNSIKSKVASIIRKFKQAAEGLEPDMEQDPDLERDPNRPHTSPVDYNFLYDELEGFNLSDSGNSEDDSSLLATPKPTLRPFFDRISHSSSQTEINSLKELQSLNQNDAVSEKIQTSPSSPSPLTTKEVPIFISLEAPESSHELHNQNESLVQTSSEVSSRPTKDSLDSGASTEYPVSSRSSSSPNTPAFARKASLDSQSIAHKGRSVYFQVSSLMPSFKEDSTLQTAHSDPTFSDSFRCLEMTEGLPENVCLVDGKDKQGLSIASAMTASSMKLPAPVVTYSIQDIHTVLACCMSSLQKYINNNSLSPTPIRVLVIGTDSFFNSILREFVECLSSRSPDWLNFLTFFIVPSGANKVATYLSAIDPRYCSLFGETSWKECIDRLTDLSHLPFLGQNQDVLTVASKLAEYIGEASFVSHLTIAEAMLTFRQSSSDEDCSQKFLPFVTDVKVGEKGLLASTDCDKEEGIASNISNAQLQTLHSASTMMSQLNSPQLPVATPVSNNVPNTSQPLEVKLELQVDYWKERDASKYTLKQNFKSLNVSRLPLHGERMPMPGLSLNIVTKGKKNIMRLPGKKGKEKDSDSKYQTVSNISRLICASKHQQSALQVKIDGLEWKDIKFFQLSSHWSSHIKTFPVAVFVST